MNSHQQAPNKAMQASKAKGDRFVPYPLCNELTLDICHANLMEQYPSNTNNNNLFNDVLSKAMFGDSPAKIVDVSSSRQHAYITTKAQRELCTHNNIVVPTKDYYREMQWKPKSTLDAPRIENNFYYNILAWSKHNILAVALSKHVYLRNMNTRSINQLGGISKVSSIGFDEDGMLLSFANTEKQVYFVDIKQARVLQAVKLSRQVLSLSWNGIMTSLGAYGGRITNVDHRTPNIINIIKHHHGCGVCGLAWSPNKTQLASGGDDNTICIWDIRNSDTPIYQLTETHKAAVKALSWNPVAHHLLVSGGGQGDQTVAVTDTSLGKQSSSWFVGGQVSGIVWHSETDIVVSHGSSVSLWNYPSLKKIGRLEGHSDRVISMSLGPNDDVATAAADETICVWNPFTSKVVKEKRPSAFSDYHCVLR